MDKIANEYYNFILFYFIFNYCQWENNLLYFQNVSARLTKNEYRQLRYANYKNYVDIGWNKKALQKVLDFFFFFFFF